MPISAISTAPQASRPGSNRWPGLRRKKVTVTAADGAAPRMAPLSPSTPLGMSTATQSRRRSLMPSTRARATPSSGRASPAPISASTTLAAPSRMVGSSGAGVSPQRSAARRASPRSASRGARQPSRTTTPASRRIRAATNPSPPLLPGPHSTATGPPASRRRTTAATAAPALSIRSMPALPRAIASASARPISATDSSARPGAAISTPSAAPERRAPTRPRPAPHRAAVRCRRCRAPGGSRGRTARRHCVRASG